MREGIEIMSGFVGFIDNSKNKKDLIKKMTDKIAHRGPDNEGYFVDDVIALGSRIIYDRKEKYKIPFNKENLVISIDGRITNSGELREDLALKGYKFELNTDEELIFFGYKEYGVDFFNKLNGLYSFVIWNKLEEELTLVKDVYAGKPLYVYENDDVFMFASEIKSFLEHPKFVKELNVERLPEYLTFEYLPDEETMFKNVRNLSNGKYFVFKNGKLIEHIYNEIRFSFDYSKSLEDWADEIEEAMADSVKRNNESDFEIGSFLSSGVDSSYVAKEKRKLGELKTFSVGYDENEYSEISYAKELADRIDSEFITETVSSEDVFSNLDKIQYYLDEPLGNPSLLPLYFLTKHAKNYVNICMSGEGADELFGGYNYYKEPIEYAGYRKTPKAIRKGIAKTVSVFPHFKGQRFLIRASKDIEERFFRHEYVFSASERKKVLKNEYNYEPPYKFTQKYFNKVKDVDDVSKMQYVDMHTWMIYDINLKADKMSMANSLELRMPILDRKLLDIALQIPVEYKVSKEETKIAFREAAGRELPQKTATKRKLGFPSPLNIWLREDRYYNQIKEMFESDISKEFFNTDYLMDMLNTHKSGKDGNMKKIWIIYCFLIWYNEYFVKR